MTGFSLFSVLGILFFFGPLKNELKSWRASSLLEEAKELAEEEKWDEVYRTAMASLQNEESLEAFRLLAKASVETGNPQSLGLAYTLFRYPGVTSEDRVWVLSLAFDAGDLLNATRLASMLSPEETLTPGMHYQLVRGYIMSGKYEEAISFADDPSVKSRDPKIDLLLADGLASTDLKGAREETTERLRVLLNSEDRELALQAVSLLAFLRDEWINEPLAQAALDRFGNDPDLSVNEMLNLELFRIGLNKRELNRAIRDATQKYRQSHLWELVLWLVRLERFQEVMELTEGKEVKEDPRLFKLRLHALENLNEWVLLEEELEDQSVFMPAPLLRATQALVALRLGEKFQSSERWLMAMDAARIDKNRNWFYQLAKIARKLGDIDQEMEATIAGINHPLGNPPSAKSLSALFQWMQENGDGERLLEISSVLLRRDPTNPLLLNNLSYLKALYKNAEAEDVAAMKDLVSRFPADGDFRDTLGFVHLSRGEAKLALKVLDESPLGPGKYSNTGKAIYAKGLHELRKRKEAHDLAQTVDWSKISSAELKKLSLPSQL